MIKAALREIKNLTVPTKKDTFINTILVILLSLFGIGLILLADFLGKVIIYKII